MRTRRTPPQAACFTRHSRRPAMPRQPLLGLRERFGQAAQHDDVARAQLGGRVRLDAANAVTADRRHFDAAARTSRASASVRPTASAFSSTGTDCSRTCSWPSSSSSIVGAVEIAAQQAVALVAHLLDAPHHAPHRHAHQHQRMRRQHQAALDDLRNHFGRARGQQLFQIGVIDGTHDHRQRRLKLVDVVQHAQRGRRIRVR